MSDIADELPGGGPCDCALCQHHRVIVGVLERECVMTMKDTIKRLEEELDDTSFDLNWHTAVLDGSWPSAREVLQAALKKCDEKEKSIDPNNP